VGDKLLTSIQVLTLEVFLKRPISFLEKSEYYRKMFETPYYAVIFSSRKKTESTSYDQVAERMEELSAKYQGFLGVQSVRGSDGFGITVSYWRSLEDIKSWKMNLEHQEAQQNGKANWYAGYQVRVCKVERQYSFGDIL